MRSFTCFYKHFEFRISRSFCKQHQRSWLSERLQVDRSSKICCRIFSVAERETCRLTIQHPVASVCVCLCGCVYMCVEIRFLLYSTREVFSATGFHQIEFYFTWAIKFFPSGRARNPIYIEKLGPAWPDPEPYQNKVDSSHRQAEIRPFWSDATGSKKNLFPVSW